MITAEAVARVEAAIGNRGVPALQDGVATPLDFLDERRLRHPIVDIEVDTRQGPYGGIDLCECRPARRVSGAASNVLAGGDLLDLAVVAGSHRRRVARARRPAEVIPVDGGILRLHRWADEAHAQHSGHF